ncbi:uncharacterized protein LOC116773037 [Danaus plexippus]|uniref:uncharacterized protein LOC116773037 n=1 Tax=Danaus plexippus TaxID=13037 RepID=UPI002AB10CDD|nr:uncharacterized protein LOC116773037 [Danaus plexippus]
MSNFDTRKLINEIKKRPSIWDTSSTDNTNKELKKKDWNEIVAIFGGDDISASDRHLLRLTLQKRWKNIRTSFARELKRQKNYGSGANRKSEYVYYKQLRFLSNVMNIAEKEADDEPEYVYYDVDVEFNQTSDDNKYEQRIENKFKRKMIDDEDTIDDNEDNEDRLFLLSLHERLRRIPKSKKTAIKIKLLSIINEALIDEVAD